MILIRADANPHVGMGHIMRCLSLADSIHAVGKEIVFLLADGEASDYVESRGYRAIILHSNYRKMEEELPCWPELLSVECLIVDSYYVTKDYLEKLKKRFRLVYIDDLGRFPYPVDVLVNYNAYGPETDYRTLYQSSEQMPELLLGVQYAPLRSMFRNIPPKKQNEKVTDILFSTGGSDELHIALKLLNDRPVRYRYHVLIGAMNSDRDELKRLAAEQENIVLHENIGDMRSLISGCDIAVSAAGSTLYEICACGVPLITYIAADNQITGANAFEKMGLAINCGDFRKGITIDRLIEEIDNLSVSYNTRVFIGIRMQNIIDGYGSDRLTKAILRGMNIDEKNT